MLVTVGATEAVAASLLALCDQGDEVVMFEPTYDSYAACAAMAGAVPRLVRLHPPDWSFDPDDLARACARPALAWSSSTRRTTRPARSSPPRNWGRWPPCAGLTTCWR